ncbi:MULTISPECIES: HEPN domain-containing protein [Aerococcus]|uniref:Uncharacterized protein n=3 Tax=Aerococcus TaxID=1375 RepID=A0A178HD61_9LACT|nr:MULTISPECIES: HEPN domain-containing protein [Aerococcus]KAA9218306.1 hypothetical protein F6I39_07480 [Aerococcus loyolae]MCY3026379.1 HEPN domain-containing protein [Aerococcus loyolae]MCY3027889.1 HEPN domain-containing protein [Aerococcus loyolae]MCY3029855.1 HEPN domain-containing protein [Aerococcus loyolae]MDK6258654.1 HEPN domain-containing protein [Aerococcus urinae]
MERIIKMKLLVSGLYPIEGIEIAGFKSHFEDVDAKKLPKDLQNNYLYSPVAVIKLAFQKNGQASKILTFNKQIKIDEEEIPENLADFLVIESEKLEKTLKLMTNINISFPAATIKIFDNNNGFIDSSAQSKDLFVQNNFNEFSNSDIQQLISRLNMVINIDYIENFGEKNNRFKRAINFYFDSYNLTQIDNKFVLLFSSLESLFNLDKYKIKETISRRASNLITFFNGSKSEKESIYANIKNLYNKRSQYIHGSEPEIITKKDEKHLREIVRKVLLYYQRIASEYQITSPQKICKLIDENDIEISDESKLFLSLL